MNTAVIYLDSEDDIVSITDRLDWLDAQRALLVLPEDGGVLREGLDLVRLRRHADRLRLEVGLVTPDTDITRQGRALGFPTFTTVSGAENSRRGWWRGRRRQERVGLPTVGGISLLEWQRRPRLDEDDQKEVRRRLSPASQSRRWLLRYLAIFLFFVTLAILFVSFSYVVPGAIITLRPETQPLRAERLVIADPEFESVDYQSGTIPGRLLVVNQSWQAEVATVGTIEVPGAPARGPVLFVNRLAQEVIVPAGTRVSTSDGSNITFQTLADVTLAGVIGTTAETEVVAVEPGPEGNVEANRINRVQGSLALQVEVRNLEPLSGGGLQNVPAVAEADRDRLRSQVLQFLQALATSEMEAQLAEREFLARDSVRLVQIFSETYSHDVGEPASRLTLEMRAELHGTAINTTEAAGLVYEALAAEVPPGFSVVPDSLGFDTGEVVAVDEQGRVTFSMVGDGIAAAELNLAGPITAITGQEKDVAVAYLYQQLPVQDLPTIDIWPTWFDRVPYLPARIEARVEAGDSRQ